MEHSGSSFCVRRLRAAFLLAVTVATGLVAMPARSVAAAPVPAVPAPVVDLPLGKDIPRAALVEFRAICAELAATRERLASGRLHETAFADSILALFERADSLAQRLKTGPKTPSWITLQRGTGYLIASLRDNWLGVAGRDGMSFAEADLALKAALAWRSGIAEAVSP